ncbi:MAG: VOC family protein [Acholeplasmataceae bacterium]
MKPIIKDVIHFYRVESLEQTKVFYQDILGFSLYKDQGKCLIFDTGGHGKIGFCTHFPNATQEQSCITLVLDSINAVDDLYQALEKTIKTIDKPAMNHVFKIYHFFFKDFEGITLEAQTFKVD